MDNTKVERWGWYSIGINVVLALLNLFIARASGSLAVEAETVHNLVDLLTAIGVLIGLKLSSRKTKAFPYGLYKLENVITVFLSAMTFFTAYEIARDAIFSEGRQATVDAWMLVGVVIATAIPLIFSVFELRVGKRVNSPALIADAKEYRAHVFTTGVVFAALIGQWLNFPLDRVAALVIVVAIAKTGWELLSDGMRVLLDASLDPETLLQIRDLISNEPSVAELKWVTGRNAGRYRFVEGEITLRTHDLERAQATVQHIETKIREAIPFIERVLIHAEPVKREHLQIAAPLADTTGTLSLHFGEAPYFALVRVHLKEQRIEEQQIIATPQPKDDKARGIYVAEWLVRQKADIILLRESPRGKGPLYVFGEAGIELRETEGINLEQALAAHLPKLE